MSEDLKAGGLSDYQFELLIGFTKIETISLFDALKDYYVDDVTQAEACRRHRVNKISVSRKLKVLNEEYRNAVLMVEASEDFISPKAFTCGGVGIPIEIGLLKWSII